VTFQDAHDMFSDRGNRTLFLYMPAATTVVLDSALLANPTRQRRN
jgi:hypothetical protein